jgi:hypothetical protein
LLTGGDLSSRRTSDVPKENVADASRSGYCRIETAPAARHA